MLNAFAEAAQVAAPPAGSKGNTPLVGRTRIATEAGGLARRSSTTPAAGES